MSGARPPRHRGAQDWLAGQKPPISTRRPLLASVGVLVPRLLRILLLCLPALGLMGAAAAPASAEQKTYTFKSPVSVHGYEVKQALEAPILNPNVNGFVTHFEVDIVDDNGDPLPIQRLMLHHIVFLNLAHRDSTCNSF